MTAVPSTHVFSAGEVVTDTTMNNNVSAPLNFLLARPICQARQTVAQSVANNTVTACALDSEDVDSSGMHSTVTNTSRLTAVFPGWYHADGGYSTASSTLGQRVCALQVNGVTVNGSATGGVPALQANIGGIPSRSMLVFLNVGDSLELQIFQTSGGALNTAVTGNEQSTLTAVWASN